MSLLWTHFLVWVAPNPAAIATAKASNARVPTRQCEVPGCEPGAIQLGAARHYAPGYEDHHLTRASCSASAIHGAHVA